MEFYGVLEFYQNKFLQIKEAKIAAKKKKEKMLFGVLCKLSIIEKEILYEILS